MEPDVSVIIVFHDEGVHALAALASMKDGVDLALAEGLTVETCAVLDRPSRETRNLVQRRGSWLDSVNEVSFGDLGLTRNAAAQAANGRFIALLDGDDLWGQRWIADAYRCAAKRREPAVWHPEFIYLFDDDGYNQHSRTAAPNPWCRAHYSVQVPSNSASFNRRSLIFENAWTANALTLREIHLRYPYDPADTARGIGFEDWGWNIKTLDRGIPHLIVRSTVHAIRRRSGSLSTVMRASGALPLYG
jgi:hypothetical protein